MITRELKDYGPFMAWEIIGTEAGEAIEGVSGANSFIYGKGGDDDLLAGRPDGKDDHSDLFGGPGNDTLRGRDGDDQLTGGEGADLMMGGRGGDLYFVDDVGDVVIERLRWNDGDDVNTVFSRVDFDMRETAVQRLFLTDGAKVGTGNALANFISASGDGSILDGGRNIDTLQGSGGDDTFVLHHKADRAYEYYTNEVGLAAGGHDVVLAYNSFRLERGIEEIRIQEVTTRDGRVVQDLVAIGNDYDNLVVGNAADNALNGRGGADTLTGGGGADDFVFSTALDYVNYFGSANVDTITDFVSGEDRIVLKGAMFDMLASGTGSNALTLGASALDADDRLLWDGETLRYDPDGSGELAASAVFRLASGTLTADDIWVT